MQIAGEAGYMGPKAYFIIDYNDIGYVNMGFSHGVPADARGMT